MLCDDLEEWNGVEEDKEGGDIFTDVRQRTPQHCEAIILQLKKLKIKKKKNRTLVRWKTSWNLIGSTEG